MAKDKAQDLKKAKGLQLELETQLLGLEKLGALPTPAADEIRNIVAEGIADKFGETYRTFPCAREGTEIRRDAVPKPCSLRKSVQEFVAEAPTPEKTSKVKGQEDKKKVVAKAITEKERATFNALAQVNTPAHRKSGSTIGHVARHEQIAPHKKASPGKQLPKNSLNPSSPIKDGASKDWQQTKLESAEKAWDVLLSQKAAAIKTTARAGNQQNPIALQTGSPMAPATQRGALGRRKDGWGAAAATPKEGNAAQKKAMTSQPPATAAKTSGEAHDRDTTTAESAKPKSSSTGKASVASSEDLIQFNF